MNTDPKKPKTFKIMMENSAKILNIHDAMDKLRYWREHGLPPGLTTSWTEFDKLYTFPPMGQLNVVTGAPSAGKSEWVESLALNMAVAHGWKIFCYSPENYPAEFHIQKLLEKYAGGPVFDKYEGYRNVNDKEVDSFEKFLVEQYSFVDCQINTASIEEIINSILLGCSDCNMAIIDPWNKLESQRDFREPETSFIGRTLTRIGMFARQRGVSFWIVAHPAKPTTGVNQKMTSLYQISGSGHWYNMVDNGFILNRSWKEKTNGENISHCMAAKIKDDRYGKFGEVDFKLEKATRRFWPLEQFNQGGNISQGELSF